MWFGASVGEGGDGRGQGGDVGEEGGTHDQGPGHLAKHHLGYNQMEIL